MLPAASEAPGGSGGHLGAPATASRLLRRLPAGADCGTDRTDIAPQDKKPEPLCGANAIAGVVV
ncbi:MAG: hypothetical protein NTX73_04105 [Rhodobacterales bacterium]|nr:hypothetical protein [Rhodobacterales bacterium]